MKKNFKFMLVALLALFGLNNAWAAIAVNDVITKGNYTYTVTKMPTANANGTVTMTAIAEGVVDDDLLDNSKKLDFPGTFVYQDGQTPLTFDVTMMASTVFKDHAYYAKSVVIPKQLTEIPEAAFNTLTNLTSITFEAESQVRRIGAQAFASTKITSFDFEPCDNLEGLNDEVFIERSLDADNPNENSYIETVKVPKSPLFKHINGAFRNLTALTTIENLKDSWITEIVEGAFANTNITELELPGKDLQYIDKNAFKGSKISNLTINVDKLLYLGGCKVNYEPLEEGEYEYEYTYTAPSASETNLYGFGIQNDEKDTRAKRAKDDAPLATLTLKGKLMGKICKNAFLDCDNLDGLNLEDLTYGSLAQFETSSFEACEGITELFINDIADNETEGYTFEKNAFKDCPIATLTMNNVTTANAVNTTAFGTSLQNVTIAGNVNANGAAFAAGAFTYGKYATATLNLAYDPDNETVYYLSSNDAITALIPEGVFDFTALDANNPKGTATVKIGEIKSKGAVFAAGAFSGRVKVMEFKGDIAMNGLTVGGTNAAPLGVKIIANGDEPILETLTFDGTIGTNGIGNGTFADFTALKTITFNGLLSSLAVAKGSFWNSGKQNSLTDTNIGTEQAPFVNYLVEEIEDYTVNPFATDAFVEGNADRIIWWYVANDKLSERILAAIQKDVQGDDYDGVEYSTKFNVYKWVAKLADPVVLGPHFLLFQDLSKNGNPKIAWGRYDLGTFELENNKYYEQGSDDPEKQSYEPTDMVIPRYQVTDGVKVKLTLYGLYTDEDNFEEVSSTYLVPLCVYNGTYKIPEGNSHLIIAKAEIQKDSEKSEFADKDVKIFFNNNDPNDDASWTEGEETEEMEDESSVWAQLLTKTINEDVYTKADDSWTHQELWDAVTRYEGDDAPDVAEADLWIMTNTNDYKGFRIDKNVVTKNDNTFIGINWYYALLANYGKNDNGQAARVIWLDDAQATAIFGVKGVNEAVNGVKNGAIYNLQGVRVSGTQKGIYIQDGKKFVVK